MIRCPAAVLAGALALTACGARHGSVRAGPGGPDTADVAVPATVPPTWSYLGPTGPGFWSELGDAFAACGAGRAQSPIDLAGASPADRGHLTFGYGPKPAEVVNTGHTVEVEFDAGGGSLALDGAVYTLRQFHFHQPSEHRVDGAAHPLEIHLVHRRFDGALAVVAVFVDEGPENPGFGPLIEAVHHLVNAPAFLGLTDTSALLPEERSSYSYQGSLTTPPCSEGVAWSVLTTPITASAAQIAAIAAPLPHPNNRPLQPRNDRPVVLDQTG